MNNHFSGHVEATVVAFTIEYHYFNETLMYFPQKISFNIGKYMNNGLAVASGEVTGHGPYKQIYKRICMCE